MEKLTEEQKKRMIEAGQAVLNMSHGVKNILQSVRSAEEIMDLALERRDIKQARRTWGILRQNLDRIQKLILDTLKFSKDETLDLQPCRFIELVESVVEAVRSQADQRNVKIIVQTDEHLETISMDSEKMRDVVMNLLINAIEAVAPETGRIIVQTEFDTNHQQSILRISDNGPGIEDADMIFEPFYSSKGNAGSGLGLTIVQKIVHKHGGKLIVQSKLGQGSVFSILVPA